MYAGDNSKLDISSPNVKDLLTNSLSDFITFVKDTSKTVGAFAKEEVPLYVKELLHYKFMETSIDLGFKLLILLLSIIILYTAYKVVMKVYKIKDRYGDIAGSSVTTILICLIVSVLTVILAFNIGDSIPRDIKTLYKIHEAPRVFIVDELKSMIR
jgi:hypothetical protein